MQKIMSFSDKVTSEEMIDAAEVLGFVRRQLASKLPYGTESSRDRKMSSLWESERLLRSLAGEE